MAKKNSEKLFQADRSLFLVSLAVDNIDCLAVAMKEEEMDDEVKSNALLFTSSYLREEVAKTRELLFGGENTVE